MTTETIPAADLMSQSAAEGSGVSNLRTIAFTKPSEFIRTRANEIRINEIFFSLQGESSRVGLPTVFVR